MKWIVCKSVLSELERKIKQSKEDKERWRWGYFCLYRWGKCHREGNFEVTATRIAEEMGRNVCECKGPEARVYTVCVKKNKEASVARAQKERGRIVCECEGSRVDATGHCKHQVWILL